MIPSSRLHHWLPLPQVPTYTGRSSEPLLGTGSSPQTDFKESWKPLHLPGGIFLVHIVEESLRPCTGRPEARAELQAE